MAREVITKTKKKNRNNVAYFFVLPFVTIFFIFSIYPVFRTLYLSFTDFKGFGDSVFNGIENYKRALTDKFFWRALGNTCKIWGVNIVVQLGTAFLLTIIFSDIKYKIRGLATFRAMFYLPNLIAATSVAFLFKTLLDWKYGSINQILVSLGITASPINWLGSASTAPYVVAVVSAWMWFGNSFIVLMAGVQGIPKDYFEAAAIDGAGRWKVFGKITLPLLKPILLYVFVTSLIGGLQMFDLPFLMAEGGTAGNPSGSLQTAVMYLYKFGFQTRQVGYASAIAYTLFFIILIVSVIQFKLLGSKED
ncbi:carbohydrate ABC transporter permease [Konateibacter massiliensis]|uniref:carbohydrate ABC transporter permease n=1 Tax=Konateibacter massiliensis TaxID=2002841 RepID=UPI000C146A9D|nr:sugar ABC transporter permease [Konateibacter massiliensis]